MLQRENYRLQQDNNKLYEKNTLLAAEQVDMQNELGESEGKYQVTKQTLYQFCMNVGTQLGIDQDFILKRIQEDNDNPNAIFKVLQAIGSISIDTRTLNATLRQQNNDLTDRIEVLQSAGREQEIARLNGIIAELQTELNVKRGRLE